MNPAEYETMSRVEADHWWYHGLRDMITRVLTGSRYRIGRHSRVLDAGCGTGGNLQLLADVLQPDYLGGFDLSPQAVAQANKKAPWADVYQGDLGAPEIHVDQLDAIISCDVICIPGSQTVLGGLSELANRLRPGGLFIINVPAYRWLRGEHDLAVHTSERLNARSMERLLQKIGLEPALITYRCCTLLPAIVAARLPVMLSGMPAADQAVSDLRVPSALVNRLLTHLLTAENSLASRGIRLPWGSSIFGVGRKPLSSNGIAVVSRASRFRPRPAA